MGTKKTLSFKEPGFSTIAIHHGQNFAAETGAVMPPIFATSTFEHGNSQGFDYTRSGNPNFKILESILSSIEKSNYSTVFGSGVSAITAIASTLKKGDLVLCEENLYGCTIRLFEQVFKKFGIKIQYLDFTKAISINSIDQLNPSLIWLESPTNPLLKVLDISEICKAANTKNIPVIVDNTFATALTQMPLDLGAKVSLTSTTKYINGHSDALGGSISTNDKEWDDRMKFAQKSLGLHPSPFDCWLITRGVKTLPLRLERQIKSASSIADQLATNPKIKWVKYPFRLDHPDQEIARKQMKNGGAIVTVSLKADLHQTYAFCKNLMYFKLAESLGGVESLVCHPATMSHSSVDAETKNSLGINDSLIRFSIGCEDLDDLSEDIEHSLYLMD